MAKSFFPQRHWTEFYGKKNWHNASLPKWVNFCWCQQKNKQNSTKKTLYRNKWVSLLPHAPCSSESLIEAAQQHCLSSEHPICVVTQATNGKGSNWHC
jgi:hypothetical protein